MNFNTFSSPTHAATSLMEEMQFEDIRERGIYFITVCVIDIYVGEPKYKVINDTIAVIKFVLLHFRTR